MARLRDRNRGGAVRTSHDNLTKSRKRQHAHGALQEEDDHPTKRLRTGKTEQDEFQGEAQNEPPADSTVHPPATEGHDAHWQYPPEFYDRLSTIPLTRRALKELDRRNSLYQPSLPPPPPPTRRFRDLACFSRHGGADLTDLRGYPAARSDRPAEAMSSSSGSRAGKSTAATSVQRGSGTSKTTKSSKSAYDRGFEQHLTDHKIHHVNKSEEPANLDEIETALRARRASLSPSAFSTSQFKAFRTTDLQTKDEEDVTHHVFPTITGPGEQMNHPSAWKTKLTNFEPLTDGTLAPAYPDAYYGAAPEDLDAAVRDELGGYIQPSTTGDKPIVPNFFVEVKGKGGTSGVASRQVRYDGALGARAMHSLQNCGDQDPVFDGKAYTLSSTYHAGTLTVYAHHPTAPAAPGGPPEYHMTLVDGYSLIGNIDGFRRGVAAYRNARDLTKTQRDSFIQAANARTSQANAPLPGLDDTADAAEAVLEPEPQTSHQEKKNVPHGAAATQPAGGRRRRESHSSASSSAGPPRQRTRTAPEELRTSTTEDDVLAADAATASWEYVTVRDDREAGDKICFNDPRTGKEYKTRRERWERSAVEGMEVWLFESKALGRTFYTYMGEVDEEAEELL